MSVTALNLTSVISTDVYMAPEVYKDEIFDRTVDAYSFGVILYEVPCSLDTFMSLDD